MKVVIRGAGDIATGIALRLWRSGMQVIMTDIERPTSIRRTVCFSEAIRFGRYAVEDATAVLAHDAAEAMRIVKDGEIAVLVDEKAACIGEIQPDAVVDAILAKKNLGTGIADAPVVVAVGPGFTAGTDCHAVVETMRGHYLGRVLYQGTAQPNTNIPGFIGGFAGERVMRAPDDGIFRQACEIGDHVKAGDITGTVNGNPMVATIDGVVRGLIADGTPVHKGMKSGDVDPRGDAEYCKFASDKAIAVGGGVLEAILHFSGVLREA